jgi:solute carrier family 25 protein 33/36
MQLSAHRRPAAATPKSPLPGPIAASAAALNSSAGAATASTLAAPSRSPFGQAFTMAWEIVSKEGIRGLYRGLSASYLGVSEGVIQWVLYEVSRNVKRNLADE